MSAPAQALKAPNGVVTRASSTGDEIRALLPALLENSGHNIPSLSPDVCALLIFVRRQIVARLAVGGSDVIATLDAWMSKEAWCDEEGGRKKFDSFCATHGERVAATFMPLGGPSRGSGFISRMAPIDLLDILKIDQARWLKTGFELAFFSPTQIANDERALRTASAPFVQSIAAVAEYLVAEIVEKAAEHHGYPDILRTEHIFYAIRNDYELSVIFPPELFEVPPSNIFGAHAFPGDCAKHMIERLPDVLLQHLGEYLDPRGLASLCAVVAAPVASRIVVCAEKVLLVANARRPFIALVSGGAGEVTRYSMGNHQRQFLSFWERVEREGVADTEVPPDVARFMPNIEMSIPPDVARADVIRVLRESAFVHCLYHLPPGIYSRFGEDPLHAWDAYAESDETVSLVSLAGSSGGTRVLFAVSVAENLVTDEEGSPYAAQRVVSLHVALRSPEETLRPAFSRILSVAYGSMGHLEDVPSHGFWAAADGGGVCAALGLENDRLGVVVRCVLLAADVRGDGVAHWAALENLHASGGSLFSLGICSHLFGFFTDHDFADARMRPWPEGLCGATGPFFRHRKNTQPHHAFISEQRNIWIWDVTGLAAVQAYPALMCRYPPLDVEQTDDPAMQQLARLAPRAREPWLEGESPRLVLETFLQMLDPRLSYGALSSLTRLCATLAGIKDAVTAGIIEKHENRKQRGDPKPEFKIYIFP